MLALSLTSCLAESSRLRLVLVDGTISFAVEAGEEGVAIAAAFFLASCWRFFASYNYQYVVVGER